MAVYRIVQESLTNSLRHAAARRIQVRLDWTDTSLTVEVADDGKGFDASVAEVDPRPRVKVI